MAVSTQGTIIFVPTQLELDSVGDMDNPGLKMEICGFGPIASAAKAMEVLKRQRPTQAILMGIAGRYTDELEIGSAYEFGQVACYGVGAGSGEKFQTAGQMGWNHWNGDGDRDLIGDVLQLTESQKRVLVSACSCCSNESEMSDRLRAFPNAAAEDMEGFGVAVACRIAGVPLSIVRGISNDVGDRDVANWKIEPAMKSAWQLVKTRLIAEEVNRGDKNQ